MFRQIEREHVLPLARSGFETVDEFIACASSVLNRRKSRTGRSFELHLAAIFREEGLVPFTRSCVTEHGKRPDFIFPSCEAYHDPEFPAERLRFVSAKTTLKDRWRQVLTEAPRVPLPIYLVTLQEGVSERQFGEMVDAGIQLVVPEPLVRRYPVSVRGRLWALDRLVCPYE